ncbi:MAG: alginate export family protein [Pseudomonadota bacterium]
MRTLRVYACWAKLLCGVFIAVSLGAASTAHPQEQPPSLSYEQDGFKLRGHFQAGANAVSEYNLYWNLSDTFAAQADFDPDANWLELYVKPGVSFSYAVDDAVTLYGKASAVASFTWGRDAFDARNTGRATWEEGYLGLRADVTERTVLDLSVGPRELKLGSGMLITNGASNGFERGALKFGPRKAWEMAGIARLSSGHLQATGFYLQPNEQRSSDSGNVLLGADARIDWPGGGLLGATYVNAVDSNAPYPLAQAGGGPPAITPGDRQGLNALSLYAETPRFEGALSGVFATGDLAFEWNPRIDLRAYAGRVRLGYRFTDLPWSPSLTYGYQTFSGDDPSTARQERFDPLYYDGSPSTWATGSKSAMLFINSNVQSHNLALQVKPTRKDTVTLRYAHVRANELGSPLQFGQATRFSFANGDLGTVISGVTDAHLSDDVFLEYSRILNSYTFLTAGFSISVPGEGIRAVVPGNTPVWTGGFVNVVVNF